MKLNKSDLAAIKRLNDGSGGRMQHFIMDVLGDDCHDRDCFLAKKKDKVIGWLLVESSSIKPFYLIDVYIHKKHRKQGIASKLIKRAIADAKRKKKSIFGFYTVTSSDLYKKLGIKNGLAVT